MWRNFNTYNSTSALAVVPYRLRYSSLHLYSNTERAVDNSTPAGVSDLKKLKAAGGHVAEPLVHCIKSRTNNKAPTAMMAPRSAFSRLPRTLATLSLSASQIVFVGKTDSEATPAMMSLRSASSRLSWALAMTLLKASGIVHALKPSKLYQR